MNTRERIWREALRLFAEKGYEGVSVKEIASEVGIKDSSIYNHYKNKQEIFDTILDECSMWVLKKRREIAINDIPGNSERLTQKDILSMNLKFFEFFLTDETAVLFRRMLIREQYMNPAAQEVFYDIFVAAPMQKETQIFSKLMEKGHFQKTDPQMMALQFYSPVFVLLELSREENPEDTERIKERLLQHVTAFGEARIRQKY